MTKEAGKGSSPRPFSVAQAEYEARWDMIFGRDSVAGRDKDEKVRDFEFDKEQDKKEETKDDTR